MVFLGLRVIRDTTMQLMDTMPDAAMMDDIRRVALAVPGVMGVEKCFARNTGFKHHVDLHLEVDPAMTVQASHDLATRVRARVVPDLDWVADVLVHVEPYPPLAGRRSGMMENREIARLLAETADLMEIAGEDPFRIRSYRNGATAIESHPERIEDILKDPARNVTEIPGIGKGLAAVLGRSSSAAPSSAATSCWRSTRPRRSSS